MKTSKTSQYRWHLNEILTALNLPINGPDIAIKGVSIDSRTLSPGDLYIALEGATLDGHDFIDAAVNAGAAAVLVHKREFIKNNGPVYILVDDSLKALHKLADFANSQSKAFKIAITGSVGKTTTKDMLNHVLSKFGKTVASKASFNNHWGVPLTLLDLEPDTDYGIFEIGMNHTGEIAPLSKLVKPDVAIITAIGLAHIGNLKSLEGIATEKATLFQGLKKDQKSSAILNGDSPQIEILTHAANGVRSITVGSNSNFDIALLTITENFVESETTSTGTTPTAPISTVTVRYFGETLTYTLQVMGRHIVQNSLLILATCHEIGLKVSDVCDALSSFCVPNGRGVMRQLRLKTGVKILLIDDSYNANPTSMAAGLSMLSYIRSDSNKNTRCIAVLGDMLELGADEIFYHQNLKSNIEKAQIDSVFCCGALMKYLFDILPVEKKAGFGEGPTELLEAFLGFLKNGDIVYIKGSKGSYVSKIVDALLEREILS